MTHHHDEKVVPVVSAAIYWLASDNGESSF